MFRLLPFNGPKCQNSGKACRKMEHAARSCKRTRRFSVCFTGGKELLKCSICEEPIEKKEDIAEVIDGEPVCVDCAEDDDDSEDDDDDEDDDDFDYDDEDEDALVTPERES